MPARITKALNTLLELLRGHDLTITLHLLTFTLSLRVEIIRKRIKEILKVTGLRRSHGMKLLGERNHFLEALRHLDAIHKRLLLLIELHTRAHTQLEIDIETVGKGKARHLINGDTEEATVHQCGVSVIHGASETWILALHLTLNTSIFNKVEHALEALTQRLHLIHPTICRCVQGVTHLMTNHQVIQVGIYILPNRKSQDTSLDIKRRTINLLVLNADVFRRQKPAESTLGGVKRVCHYVSPKR